ncbi:type IV secretory system conjugative DNA transfer family protein [Lysinibacillus sphaericus]|nr:type IV secretory system conjugative DNA transfer family protein [Lysinibacillus sphaericus]
MSIPVRWGGSDMFTHMLVVGPTRCGKTATILKPLIYQLLVLKAKGVPLGLSVIEPKGDVAAMVNEMCFEMGIPCTHIDPMMSNTAQFNPMEGEINAVAEATVIVLKGLFGKQDAFFATVQELSARNVTKLLKELHGDNIDIVDVMNTLRDERVLAAKVAELKARDGMTDLVHFFESELLGSMKDKYRQFVIGLRAQLENVVSNDALRQIMTGKSSFNIDEHYAKGGVLAVNTALGMLRTSGDAFGQFLIMHLQNGAFRRPGTEFTRIPHFLIVDEYSRYINPDVEIFLNLAAEYRVAGIFATQSLGQLELESGKISAKAMKRAILGGCRNLVVFGGIKSEDAKDFAEEFGKDKILMRQSTYKNSILLPNLFPDSYRDTEIEEYRFDATDLMDGLPRFHFVHKLLQDGHPQKPAIAKGQFVRRDWKEEREWEQRNDKTTLKMGPLLSSIPILSMLIDGRKRRKKETSCVDKQEESIHTQNLNVQSIESNNLMNQKSGQDPLNVNNRPFKTNVSTQMNGGDGKCIATEIRKDNLTSVLTKEQSKQLDGKEGFLQTEIKKLYEKNQNKSINKGSQEKIKYPESNQEINLNSKDNFWD